MIGFLARRLATIPLVVLGVVTILFVIFKSVPGDEAAFVAGATATQAEIEAVRVQLGLDRPLVEQYVEHVAGLGVGNFGYSTTFRGNPLPHIVNRGAEWFAGLGTNTQGGTRLYSVSGRVKRPAVYEASVAITLRQLIYDLAGGVTGNGRLKAVVPGGSSAPILRADEIDVTMDVDGLRNAGTMAGSAGVIVMDETASIPEALMVVARFYAHESCGQCTPCRESTGWIYRITERILEGRGRKQDLDTILDVARRGAGTTICAFYDGAVGPYISYIEKFRDEFEALIPT